MRGLPIGRNRTPRASRRAHGLTTAALVAGALAAGALTSAVPAAADAPAAAESVTAADLGLEAVAGYGGQLVQGAWNPVEVTIAPDRLVAGTLSVLVEGNGGRQAERREVEVAAGAVKLYRFLVPPAHGLSVELEVDDRVVRTRSTGERSSRYLVGVLGEAVPDGAPPVNAYALQTQGELVAVPDDWLHRSELALDPLAALVATDTQLRRLSEQAQDNLRSAVAAGLDLVVVTSADGPIDLPLPPGWVPATAAATVTVTAPGGTEAPARVLTPTDRAWRLRPVDLSLDASDEVVAAAVNAGRGRVHVVGVGLGEGPLGRNGAMWGRLAQPHGVAGASAETVASRMSNIATQTLRSDDFDLPPLGLLALFLVIYLLVVGPVNGVVLSRAGRPELAWVTVPVITVVFSGLAWAGAAGSSPDVGLSARATWWIDGQGQELAVAALRDPRAGEHEIALPGERWQIASTSWSRPGTIDRSGADTVLRLDLEALEVGNALGFRTTDASAPMSIQVESTDTGLAVVIHNVSTRTIENVTVRAATRDQPVGTLAPGEERRVELDLDGDPLPVVRAFGDDFEGLRGVNGELASAPESLEALLRWTVLDGAPGVVWATGTVDDELGLGGVRGDGRPTQQHGTFVAVGATPAAPDGTVSSFEVQRQVAVPSFGDLWQPGPLGIEGRAEVVLRFRLPRLDGMAAVTSSLDRGQLNDGGFVERCFTQEVRGEDGGLLITQEVCGDPGSQPPPPCPPDATSCEFDGTTFEICYADGTCETAEVTAPDVPAVDGSGLEVWDHVQAAWVPLAEAFPDGVGERGGGGAPRGVVVGGARGALHPFDFGGRGGAARGRSASTGGQVGA